LIEPIDDMPAGTIGFRIRGDLTDVDYREVLAPALKAAAGAGDVRLLLAAEKGFDLGTLKSRFEELRRDPELDLGHGNDWKRVAVVADANFIYRAAFPALSQVVPVDVKLFSIDDEADAKAWVAG
jgi:SpoIIAA-like